MSILSKHICIFALLAVVALAGSGVPVVTVCSAPNSILKNLQYQITPNNIVPGVNLTVSISGTLIQSVQTASATVTASFDGIPITKDTVNLCSTLACPIPAGSFTYSISKKLPNIPVSGTVTAQAVVTADTNLPVACVDVSVSV